MKKIEALAEVRGVKVIPHVFGLGHIVAANLDFILASNTGWMEFPFIPDEFQLLAAPIKVKDGFVDAIDKPGLGVAVDAAALDRYSIA